MSRSTTPIAVVGAGPAGAWAAYSLARRGARVIVIDGSHPREKPCGGGVTGRALAIVADAVPIDALPATRIAAAQFLHPSARDAASVELDPQALVVVSRTEFDRQLLDAALAAGAELLPARVTDVVEEGDGFRLATTAGPLGAAKIVGADGATSLVRRRLARPFRRDQLSVATGYFASGATSADIVIEIVDDPPGYIWSFPRPTHLAIGICAQADAVHGSAALRARVERWIERTRIAAGARLEPYSWPIPSLGARDFAALDVAGPGWCLVGDAAGLVDPITREGIYFALLSAVWAAEALGSEDEAGASHRYTSRVRTEIGSELARAARFKAGFFRPRFARLLHDALRCSTAVRDVMADLVAGEQTYRGLKWRLLQTLELGLAWQIINSR